MPSATGSCRPAAVTLSDQLRAAACEAPDRPFLRFAHGDTSFAADTAARVGAFTRDRLA